MQNPDWTRDELIVALAFYLKHRVQMPDKRSKAIHDLSDTINRLGNTLFGVADRGNTFRNINGVYMKMMNFRALDPEFTGQGKRGLTRGAKGDSAVWNDFSSDPQRCEQTSTAIVAALSVDAGSSENLRYADEDDEESDAPEGKLLTSLHRRRERSRSLVRKKLSAVRSKTGALKCEVCNFDFHAHYGELGEGFAECHHLRPVSTLGEGARTQLADLAVVCANCHRMIHRRRPWLSVESLKDRLLNASVTDSK